MEAPSLFQPYCSFYSICSYYGDGLEMERGGNCLILDGNWLRYHPYSICTRIVLYFIHFLLLGWCSDGEGSCPH